MSKYLITRIIGNELLPRDIKDSKLKILDFILSNEPDYENCEKIWVINQVHDVQLKLKFIELLNQKRQMYYELKFNPNQYLKCKTRTEKICCAVNINAARNYCIDVGKKHTFTFVLDGDCYFTEKLWKQTIEEIEFDQLLNERKYYGIPIVRTTQPNQNIDGLKLWEPNIAFRNDATLRFKESQSMVKDDKVELLQRLGYQRNLGETALSGELCRNVGCLVHVSFGNEEAETNLKTRIRLRNESLDRLLNDVDESLLIKML